jgi:hypothetical protein
MDFYLIQTFLKRHQDFFSTNNSNVLIGSMIANLICNHPIIFKNTLDSYMMKKKRENTSMKTSNSQMMAPTSSDLCKYCDFGERKDYHV